MFRTARKVCKWVFVILVVVILTAGGFGTYYYFQSDELLQQGVLSALKKWAPDADVHVGRCRLDWFGRVHVEALNLAVSKDDDPLIDLPETVVDLDREAFLERQEVVVSTVRVIQPRLELIRDADGVWNWQKLPPLPKSSGRRTSLPTCELENASLVLRINRPDLEQPGVLELDDVDITLTPSGKRSLLIEGTTSIERVGRLKLDGRLNVDTKTGSLTGRLDGLRIDRNLLGLAASFEPSVLDKITAIENGLREQMRRPPDPRSKLPFSIEGIGLTETGSPDLFAPLPSIGPDSNSVPTVGARNQDVFRNAPGSTARPLLIQASDSSTDVRPTSHRIPALMIGAEDSILGLRADLGISFRVSIPAAGARPEARVVVDIKDGEITNTAMPFPLESLSGQIECTENDLTIRKLSGVNGPTKLEVNGAVFRAQDGPPSGRVDVKLTNLACDQRLRNRLSGAFGRIYDAHHPGGFLDMQASLTGADGKWTPGGLVVTAKRCTVAHDVFPYPVENAVGTITQDGKDLIIDMLGYVGTRPITLKGFVKNPGPAAWIRFDIAVEDLPIDDAFYNACKPAMRATLDSMSLGGFVSGTLVVEKPAGEGTKMMPYLSGRLAKGTMAFESFPYRVDQLTGALTFDGLDWKFEDLKGKHGNADLTAHGTYITSNVPTGELNLTITTENAPIDETLRQALPPTLKELWSQFNPSGTIKKSVTKTYWQKGQPARITLPELIVTDTTINMQMFPWEMTDGDARFRYEISDTTGNGVLFVDSYTARHGRTRLSAQGNVQIEPDGDWWAKLTKWSAEDFYPDSSFLSAISPDLASVFSSFAPDRPMDVSGMLQFRGKPDPRIPMTAAWDVLANMKSNRISIGVDLDDVHGELRTSGLWTGFEVVDGEGRIDLTTLTLLDGYRLHNIRGPFQIGANEVWAGSRSILDSNAGRSPSAEEQITADFLGGVLSINARTTTGDNPEYFARVNLSQGKLERYAKLYMNGTERMQGVMNGWVNLEGAGTDPNNLTGQGQLQIDPAALYELPVILQVMNALTIAPQDNSFFRYARVDFGIARQEFQFKSIDLVGQPLQLRGKGRATFDGDLALNFVPMQPDATPSTTPRPRVGIPLVNEVAGLFTGVAGLVGAGSVVEVTGKTSNPKTRVIPLKNLDSALRGFFDSLAPVPLTPPTPPRLPPVAGSGGRGRRR